MMLTMTQRERIIEQAAKMFAEQGIKSIRMDDIARALAVSKRTLYEMFEDKEELLYLSIRFMQSRRMAKMEAKEAITACAIKAAFPKIRMPRIDELTPDEEKRVIIHGRAPLPVRAKLVAQRKFDFFAEDGHLYASLRIKPA